MMDRVRRWLWPLAVVGLLGAAWLAATLASAAVTSLPIRVMEASSTAEPSRPPASYAGPQVTPGDGESTTPAWIVQVVSVLCLLIAVTLASILVIMLMRTWTGRQRPLAVARDADVPAAAPSAEEVVAALDAGLAALTDVDADPRRAVIACWVRLEQAAATAGTPRQVGDSPTDLVRRLLNAHRVSRPVLDRLAAVYREARYATHAVDERMRETAVSALRQLRGELTARVGGDRDD